MDLSNIQSLKFFMPELILIGTILLVLIVNLISPPNQLLKSSAGALFGLGLSFVFLIGLYPTQGGHLFFRMMALDRFSLYFKSIFTLSAILVIFISIRSREVLEQKNHMEYHLLILSMTLGTFLLSAANDLLMIYVGFELTSLASYLLTGFLKRNRFSSEAALKYAIYGAVASGSMLFGMSYMYGLTGTTNLELLGKILSNGVEFPLALTFSTILIMSGLGYKIASVPFHMWCPDAYQGAPTPVTALLSVAPKAAGFAVLIRILHVAFSRRIPGLERVWFLIPDLDLPLLVALLSAATMTLGNLIALKQTNLKRLLAYSSIAHAGYIMMGLAVATAEGLKAALFYVAVYMIMNLGAFLALIVVANPYPKVQEGEGFEMDNYGGLGWKKPVVAICLSVFLFSLIGLPPTGGFVGKWYLFLSLIHKGVYWLAVVGVLNSVVSLYYYVRIIKTMFINRPVEGITGEQPISAQTSHLYIVLLLGLALLIILLQVYFSPLVRLTNYSLHLV